MASWHVRMRPVGRGDTAAVLGAGRSGIAALKLLCRLGAETRLLERDEKNISTEARAFIEQNNVRLICGEHTPQHFAGLDFLVLSPGIPATQISPLLPDSLAERPELLAEMELAWRQLQGEPVLAVSGTSGKTTTASLAAAMLRRQGLNVFLGGNIGTPLSEYVLDGRQADVLVLEISSFQLQTCSSFHPRVSVLLNISENHLDYHADMREYIEAKFRLFRWQDEADLAVLGKGLEPLVKRMPIKARQVYFAPCGRFSRTQLFGEHNQGNMEAAYQACREFGVSEEKAGQAAAAFKPLPHRLERVDEKDGVLFVNDSKCTTVTALKVALKAFDRPVRLLAGGRFKGGDLASLRELVKERVRVAGLFGAGREYFEKAWQNVVPMYWSPGLEEAVRVLAAGAQAGDVVLLAPAAASFDLYADYEARGNDFKRIVKELLS
ncbi:MAG: UDP-N-acetylmuramoyl-L-alanine--D-glutamate ligase [Desulfovibrionaceae bacterium]|nr:UDP-N-acetylmuramoyl-L-alanine--D-glutamate ligase [Desulfovibrionaceae bacterium]